MKEKIRSLFSILEKDPTNESAMNGLEEIVTGDDLEANREVVVAALLEGRKALEKTGQYEAACKILDLELLITEDVALEVALLKEQAHLYDDELFDQKMGLSLYQKALSLVPEDEGLTQKIDAIQVERENWKQIVERFVEQAEGEDASQLKGHMLHSAAERIYKNYKRGKDIPQLLKSALEADPTHVKAARLCEKVLRERGRYDELAEMSSTLAEHRRSKVERVQMLLASAHVFSTKLEDEESAAIQYSQVLDLDPGNKAALQFLVQYYEEKEQWDHLVSVYEDALAGDVSKDDEIAILMQAGMVYWRMQGSLDKAEKFFKRLKKLAPAHQGMVNFYRAYAEEKGDNNELLQILNDAQRSTSDEEESHKLTTEIARLAARDGGNVERAIDAFKEILRREPDNAEAKTELKRLYKESEKWNALLDLLKGEVESFGADQVAEKIALHSQMAAIYGDHLSLGTMVIKSYKTILDLDPQNAEAQNALAATYENEGRWNDLINLLSGQVALSEDPEEKVSLLNRIATLWIEKFNNFNRAVDPLEQILSVDPANVAAISALKQVYQKRRAWRPLADLLEKEVDALDGDAKLERLVELAGIISDRLSDHARSIKVWRQVLEIDPDSAEALGALEKLTERSKDWEGLSEVIDLKVDQTESDDEKIALLTKLGTILKDRIKDPARAAKAWRRILSIKPGHAKAIRSLKEAYLNAEDWDALEELYRESEDYEGLVEVFGIAADRSSDKEIKLKLSFRCAEIYDDPIGQPDRAVRHYERVLSVDNHNERAARALVPIYRRGEKWNRLLGVFEIILEHTDDATERATLMDEMREIATQYMNNRAQAFEWASRAFVEIPRDEGVREKLEEAAETANAFDELVALYRKHIDAFEGAERLEMERYIAQLSLERLGSMEDAVRDYQAILARHPGDEVSLQALENIFRTSADWESLISVYDQRIGLTEDPSRKRELLIEVAELYEEGLDDFGKARERYRTVLELFPSDRIALKALESIARMNENWSELTEILEEQRNIADISEESWKEITGQLAALFDTRMNDADAAVTLYEEILDRFPGDEASITAMEHFLKSDAQRSHVAKVLEPHLVEVENWRILAWVLSVLIEDAGDAEERLTLQLRLADVYGTRLGDEQLAFETLGAALREHPGNKELWERMSAMATNLDAIGDLVERFEDAYTSGKLASDAEFELAAKLADLIEIQLERSVDAAPYHARVFETDPGAAGAFTSLEAFYSSEGKWDELIHLYKRALDGGAKVKPALDLQLNICFVLEEIRHDSPAAIGAYREVLMMDPGNAQAMRALATLYEEVEAWSDLDALLKEQLTSVSGDEETAIRFRLGEINERYLDRAEEALSYYEEVLNQDSDHLRSQEALERFLETESLQFRAARVLENAYEKQGAAEQLARVLMIEIRDGEMGDAERISILTRVADLRERRLNDTSGAFDVLAAAFKLEPAREEVRQELQRLAEQAEMNDQYATVLDEVIPTVGDDQALAAELISTVARLYDEQLGDFTRAEQAYRQLLNLDKENPDTALPAIKALERMLTASESYQQLLEVLRIKARLIDDPEIQKAILHQMAEIEETVLQRIDNAISLYNEILNYDTADLSALSGLERLYEQKQEWLDLIDILQRRSEVLTDSGERRDLLFRVATLYRDNVEDMDEAITAYNRVSDEVGLDAPALAALEELYQKTEHWEDLLRVYESEEQIVTEPEEKAALYFKMGDLLRKYLDSPERAVARLGDTLRIDPFHAKARQSLEEMLEGPVRRDAIKLLRPIYQAEANYEQILRCDEITAEELDDPFERAKVLQGAAEVAEEGLGDTERAFALLGRAFRFGAASPELVGQIVRDLERLSVEVSGNARLVELYREVSPDIIDMELQIQCSLRVAEIAHLELEDTELARDYFVKVLDIDGENLMAMDSLEKIYEAEGQYVDLFEIYRRKVQTITDEGARQEILFKQARVCEERLDDISGAISTYESILEFDVENTEAMEALERLYPKAELWADLMSLLERRAELTPDARADLLHRLGNLAEEKLGDDERALEYYARVLNVDPEHQGTLSSLESAMEDDARRGRVATILEPVYKRSGDWAKLVGALEARLEYCDDMSERKELLRQMGTRYEEQLGDLDTAFETFARLFKEDIEDESSREVLTRLASVLEIWPRLAEIYAEVLDDIVGDTPTSAELSFILGDLYERLLNKPKEATEAYRRSLAFSPDDEKSFAAVERMLDATQNWPDLLELYRDAADHSLDMEKRKAFIYKIAEIHEDQGDLDAAIVAYTDVLEIDDRDERAVSSLDRLYSQAGRYEDLAIHIRTQIDRAEEPMARNKLRCRLGKVYEDNLSDPTSAVDVYEEALGEEGGGIVEPLNALEKLILEEEQRQRIAEILEPIYRETDEWKKLIVILKTLVDYIEDPHQKSTIWKEIADLHYTRGESYLLAFKALGKAFEADPSDKDLLDELTRLAEQIEEWDVFVAILSDVVEDIYDLEIKRKVLHLLGATYDQRLDMPRKAIEAYRGILEIDEADTEALNALEGLYNLVGDWDGLVEVLAAKANFADDPLERAEVLRTKASIHEDLMSAPDDAVEAYRQAMDADPLSTITMDALERLYEESESWHELVEIKEQRVNVITDVDDRLAVMRSIAGILEEKIDDPIEAISMWQTVLDQAPQDPDAIQALDRLYTKESMFIELLENLNLQKDIAKDQAVRVELSNRIGIIQEKELSNLEGAIESYRDVLLEQPTHAGAIDALTRIAEDESVRARAIEVIEPIHREAERYDALADIIELKMEILDDAYARLSELLSLAALHEEGRSDPHRAFEVYTRALAEDPSQAEVMTSLERIAEAENLWEKLTDAYLQQADNAYDASAEWTLLKRVGQIRETRLSDIKGAIDAYRRALDSGTTDMEVLVALDRLYESEGMWPELDEIFDREIEMTDTSEAINRLKLRQGRLREQEFNDVAGAIGVFRDVIESDPENLEASQALEALLSHDDFVEELVEILTPAYEIRGAKEKIGELFTHRLRVAAYDADKVQLYKELAIHQEDVIGDANAAFDAYTKAFSLDPEELSLLNELERLATTLGAWAALADAVEAVANRDEIDPSAAVDLWLQVAKWAATNVGDPVKAESMYRSVLEKEPGHMDALLALEELLKNLGKFEDLLPIMRQRADAVYDYEAKKALYMSIAEIARSELSDAKQAKEAYLAVRELDEADIDSLDALISITRDEGDYTAQVEYLVARAEYTVDMVEANRYRHQAATIYLEALEKVDEALDLYRQIIEQDPVDKAAAGQLKTLYRKLEQYADLREFMIDQVASSGDESERVELLKELAALDEKQFEEPDDAIGHLNEIILIRPDDDEVVEALTRLYRKTERWHDLVELLEGQVDRARDAGDTETELRLLVQVGDLLDKQLNDTDRATDIYERVLERDDEHTLALAALARLYESTEDWEKCEEVLKRAASTGRGGVEEAEVHYRLSRLYKRHMEDEARAAGELQIAVDLNPAHMEANAALQEYCRFVGDHQGLLSALVREEACFEEKEEKVSKLVEIADLQSKSIGDEAGAVVTLEKAREMVPDNIDVLLMLSDAYIAAGRQEDAIPVIEALIDAETQGGAKRSKKAAVYHHRLAKAYLSRGQQDKGLEHLEAAYKLDISNVEVLMALSMLNYSMENYDRAMKLFRALLLQRLDPSVDVSKADIYWHIGDIWLRQGEPRKAKGMFRRGLDENPEHDGCKEGIAKC